MIWNPQLKKDVHSVERRRLTKSIPHLRNLSYEERLRRLNLPSLTYRRYRGDMINTWKFLTGEYNIEESTIFIRSSTKTRGHSKKLYKHRHFTNRRGNFFTQRVIRPWNELPEEVIAASNVNIFKKRLDEEWATKNFLYNYEL